MKSLAFKKVTSPDSVVNYLHSLVLKHLKKGEKVFWLVAGGSSIDIAVQIADRLTDAPNLPNLAITLTDERYGPRGHKDSNWQQLQDKGFSLPGARLLPVLDGSALEVNARHYAGMLAEEIANADFSVALAGMGADGHIFGIKPGSPSVNSRSGVIGYTSDDYQRLTPTIILLDKLDETVLYAVGAKKHSQLDNLAKNLPPSEQPAQLLKRMASVTIYNDWKGEEA